MVQHFILLCHGKRSERGGGGGGDRAAVSEERGREIGGEREGLGRVSVWRGVVEFLLTVEVLFRHHVPQSLALYSRVSRLRADRGLVLVEGLCVYIRNRCIHTV